MKLSKVQLAIIALVFCNIIWGASFPIYKWALENLEPFTFAYIRFFLGTLIIFPFVANRLKIQRKDYLRVLALALTGVTLTVSFWFLGLQMAISINAPIIGSTGPIFLLIFAFIFLHEKLKTKTIIGTVVSLMGVMFIVFRPALEAGSSGSILGNIFFLLATLSGIIHALLIKKIVTKYNLLTLTFWTFLIGSTALLPLALYETYTYGFLEGLNQQGVAGLFYGTVFSSVIAYSLLAFGLKYIQANEVGIFSYIDPIIAAMIAMPLLGEEITVTYLFGSLLVFLGIYIAEGRLQYHPFHRLKKHIRPPA
ncbi:MAG: DMT family transporter [Candidatus Levybacteria bacterium]|nr:DMT family transporter [Candidatus Levybacteria bacterium]